jgi:hypothetical protein
LHRFLHADMQRHTALRDAVVKTFTMEGADDVINMARGVYDACKHDAGDEQLSWYVRHRVGRGGLDEGREVEEEEEEDAEEEKKDPSTQEDEECPCDVFGEVCADDGDY